MPTFEGQKAGSYLRNQIKYECFDLPPKASSKTTFACRELSGGNHFGRLGRRRLKARHVEGSTNMNSFTGGN